MGNIRFPDASQAVVDKGLPMVDEGADSQVPDRPPRLAVGTRRRPIDPAYFNGLVVRTGKPGNREESIAQPKPT